MVFDGLAQTFAYGGCLVRQNAQIRYFGAQARNQGHQDVPVSIIDCANGQCIAWFC